MKAEIAIGSIPGLVPEYHVIAAAKKAGYRYFDEWQELDWQKKAQLVAHYFADKLIESHVQAAINRELERRSRRAKSKKK